MSKRPAASERALSPSPLPPQLSIEFVVSVSILKGEAEKWKRTPRSVVKMFPCFSRSILFSDQECMLVGVVRSETKSIYGYTYSSYIYIYISIHIIHMYSFVFSLVVPRIVPFMVRNPPRNLKETRFQLSDFGS